MAFPMDELGGPRDDEDDEPEPTLLGDVVICPDVAAANAPGHAGTYDDEIALLLVHGILHVLGMDHADPDEEREMQAKERSLLERFHKPQ
jgi:probable rRNA maturation factor